MAGKKEDLLEKLLKSGGVGKSNAEQRLRERAERAEQRHDAAQAKLLKLQKDLKPDIQKAQKNTAAASVARAQERTEYHRLRLAGAPPDQLEAQRKKAVSARVAHKQARAAEKGLTKRVETAKKDAWRQQTRFVEAKRELSEEQKSPGKLQGLGRAARGILGKDSPLADKFGSVELGERAMRGGKAGQSAKIQLAGKAVKAIKDWGKGVKEGAGMMFSGLGTAMGSDRIEHQGKGLATMTKGAGKMLGPFGKSLESMGKLGETVFESVEAFRKLNESMHEANMKFADFSGGMASVKAVREVQDIMLSMERGERRAGSAAALSDSQVELNQRLAVIEDYIANLFNWFMSDVNKLVVKLLDWISRGKLKEEREDSAFEPFFGIFRDPETGRWEVPRPPERFR